MLSYAFCDNKAIFMILLVALLNNIQILHLLITIGKRHLATRRHLQSLSLSSQACSSLPLMWYWHWHWHWHWLFLPTRPSCLSVYMCACVRVRVCICVCVFVYVYAYMCVCLLSRQLTAFCSRCTCRHSYWSVSTTGQSNKCHRLMLPVTCSASSAHR